MVMTCPQCQQPTSRLVITANLTACARCLGLSESGGPALDGTLTRNSQRVREQQREHEGDMILPHAYDKASKKVVANPDFLQLYPDKMSEYFSQTELEQQGYTKVGEAFERVEAGKAKVEAAKQDVTFKPGTPEV